MEHPGINGSSNEVISCSDGVDVTSKVQIKLQKSRSHISLLTFQHSFYCNQINPHVKASGQLLAAQLVDKHLIWADLENINYCLQKKLWFSLSDTSSNPKHRTTRINSNTGLLSILPCPLNSEQGVQWSNPNLCLYTVPISAVITLSLLHVGSSQSHASFDHLIKIINPL